MFPFYIMHIVSDSIYASSKWCVVKIIELFNRSFNFYNISHTDRRDNGSKPDVGSSNIKIYGLPKRAIATDTFLLLPPDNYLTLLSS